MQDNQKALIRTIESFQIGFAQKVKLILLALNLIKGARIKFFEGNQTYSAVATSLYRFGFICYPGDRTSHWEQNQTEEVYIAHKKNDLMLRHLVNLMRSEYKSNSSTPETRQLCATLQALAFRYPKTVIHGIIEDTLIDPATYSAEMNLLKKKGLLCFPLSIDHHEEELALVQKWEIMLTEFAPELMSECPHAVHA
jgi:hypothetical protein